MRPAAAIALLWLSAPALAADDAGCAIAHTRTNAEGIGTYSAECRWPVAPSFVAAIVGEPGQIAAVTSSLTESTRLPDGRVVNVIAPGWPFDERQSTLAVERMTLADGGLLLAYSLATVQAPLAKGRVQTLRDDGRWEIRADGSGGTRLRYENTYDAGGDLPLSLVQRAMPRRMTKSLSEVRAAAETAARRDRTRAGES